jgi:hypothetical protein
MQAAAPAQGYEAFYFRRESTPFLARLASHAVSYLSKQLVAGRTAQRSFAATLQRRSDGFAHRSFNEDDPRAKIHRARFRSTVRYQAISDVVGSRLNFPHRGLFLPSINGHHGQRRDDQAV